MALTVPVLEIVEKTNNPLLVKHESWERVLLGHIATVQNGYAFKSSLFTNDEGMPLIRIRDVGEDGSDTFYKGEYDAEFVVQAGDLLVGMDGDFKCARWRGSNGLLNQRVCRIILHSKIYHPKFLDYALPGYLKAIHDVTSSVTVKHLSSKSIKEIPLPLPPLEAQTRIVAEIEKQFSRLDEAVANLKRVKANLKRYKAAVLKAAVEGKLTEEWRKQHPDVEPADKLLERILAERRKAAGKGKYKEPVWPDTSEVPELPVGWVWAALGQLIDDPNYGTSKKCDYDSGSTGVLRIPNIASGFIDASDLKSANFDEKEKRTYTLKSGDILTIRSNGSVSLVGKCALVRDDDTKFLFAGYLIRLRPSPKGVLSEYLMVCFSSQFLRMQIEAKAKSTSGVNNINSGELQALVVPLCGKDEQGQIIAEVESRLSIIDGAEAQVDANLRRADRLRQSILKKAFSGQLLVKE